MIVSASRPTLDPYAIILISTIAARPDHSDWLDILLADPPLLRLGDSAKA